MGRSFVAACWFGLLTTPAALGYRAAVFEHQAVSPCGSGSCGPEQNAASLEVYEEAAANASALGCQVIVFPEYGITGFSTLGRQAWISGGYAEEVPEATGQELCKATLLRRYASATRLSCIAQRHKLVVVANLMEHANGRLFNTDLAFDSGGTFLAKYRKQNLWDESEVDTPEVCEVVSFTTSIGVEFGLFTCADMIYKHPASNLLAQGIRNFAVPVAWNNGMSQMQVLGYAQGWSLLNSANLLMANHLSTDESGSGIFVRGASLASRYDVSGQTAALLIAAVPDEGAGAVRSSSLASAGKSPHRILTSQGSAVAQPWRFSPLANRKVCLGKICCVADAVHASAADGFSLAVLSGVDTGGGQSWPAQACAVLPCSKPDARCLDMQYPPHSALHGITLVMQGSEDDGELDVDNTIIPEVIAYDAQSDTELLLGIGPGGSDTFVLTEVSGAPALQVNATQHALLSVVMYKRLFDKDKLSYSCPDPTLEALLV